MKRARPLALALAMALAGLTALPGCRSDPGTVLLVVVTLSGTSPPVVAALDVTLDGQAGSSQQRYPASSPDGITFPTTLSATLAARVSGDLRIDVRAVDGADATVARGRAGPFPLRVGGQQTIYVHLDCGGDTCAADGGADGAMPGADGGGDGGTSCGNGAVDPGETCDVAIAPGAPGACPAADCDDHVPCTIDTRSGGACTATCEHDEIRHPQAGDACCPAGATSADDADCSATCGNGSIETGETCDVAIPRGAAGACPGAADCADGDPCTRDDLVSAGTCNAVCARRLVASQSGGVADGCCPAGARNTVDVDCRVACGDGVVEAGETCELGPGAPAGARCPTACDDHDACTLDLLEGAPCHARCVHQPSAARVSGDGCCPPGATHATDGDCPAACGNGVVEPGESCDDGAGSPLACPTTCAPGPHACVRRVLAGSASACTARCELALVTACANGDGCCAAGCNSDSDSDCAPVTNCGSGTVDEGETCDVYIPPGRLGACPSASSCGDGNACTQDILVGAVTCNAACVRVPVTAFRAGDGCCPSGADFTLDPDCAPVCGNGVVETPAETCDFAAGSGACPATCPAGGACLAVHVEGAPDRCTSRCVTAPVTGCAPGDGCCPPGCGAADDDDCPAVCGDGVVEVGERCDRGLPAGAPGSCPATCDDRDACTADFASGTAEACSRVCTRAPITACLSGDGCCPAGCTHATDGDC